MTATYVHFAPDVPGLPALGARSFADLIGDQDGLSGIERADRGTRASRAGETWRYPLPGTPDARGRLTGRPCGAGTGWVRLRRFHGAGLGELLRTRLGAPRSLSLAEREWNLNCHLRAHGVGAPDLLAFGREGNALFARRSFLVMRELEGFRSLREIAASETDALVRRRVARAVGLCLDRLFRSGTDLPRLDADHILVSRLAAPGERVDALGLPAGRLPEIVLTALEGGSIGRPASAAARVALLERLRADLPTARARELLRAGLLAARDLVRERRLGS